MARINPREIRALKSRRCGENASVKDEITIDDPGTWTKPWSLMIPLQHSKEPVFEYACHEGNEGLTGILAGARADEAAAAKEQNRK